MKKLILFFIFSNLLVNFTYASCEQRVDNIQTLYVNGMFTKVRAAEFNTLNIEVFIRERLPFFEPHTHLLHNKSEALLKQVFEVIRQKYEDKKSSRAIIEFINNDPEFLNDVVSHEKVQEFLQEIKHLYQFTESEADGKALIIKTQDLLDNCGRLILITHSQGNFYGNMAMTHFYSDYRFPSGYPIHEYPMLGNMQIASPVDEPGGAISRIYPNIIGHITNKNDVIMGLVRNTIGSVAANYDSAAIKGDWTGHELEQSYLGADGQGEYIHRTLERIAVSLIPYPMHKQETNFTSTAISGYGYSPLNTVLDIQFTDKSVYRYRDVPIETAEGVWGADAIGTYFNKSIRNKYAYQKLE